MYGEYIDRMESATSASERKNVVAEMCRMFAFKTAKAYSVLKENGWQSGRRKREDAGTSSVTDEDLAVCAALLKNSLRKNGKQTMPVTVARSVLKTNGFYMPISNSRLRQLLRENNMAKENRTAATPHTRMRSEHPNQVHLADPSLSLLYYTPGGKQKFLRDDEVYKNKQFLEGREDLKLWRYVLTDHYSSSICVRYYAAKGESAANMYDFLLYAWGQKKTLSYTFHGLPELLYWDKGSGNVNKPTTAALTAMRVKTDTHEAGNPRAKGQVECANNIVETHFECLLKLEPLESVEELNEAAERWCAAYNANLIDHYDARLHRGGKVIGSRQELWEQITEEQLRELPDAEICRYIFTAGIQSRKVAGDLTVGVTHPKTKRSERYSLSHLPGILIGQTVNVQPILVDRVALAAVSYEFEGELVSFELEPIAYDDAGFELSAAVMGKQYKSKPDTVNETNAARLAALAGGEREAVPFAGVTNGEGFKTHSSISAENPFISQRTGTQIEANTVQMHEISITLVEAAKRVKARTGGYLPDGFIGRLKVQYPDGVIASSLVDDLAHDIMSGAKTATRGRNYA